MRILWHSVKPNIPTGYGMQTKLFVQGLCKRGYDVDVSCTSGLYGAVEQVNYFGKQVRLFPHSSHSSVYGMDVVESHWKYCKADWVISFIDCFIFNPEVLSRMPWISWVPVDSDPVMVDNTKPLQASKYRLAPTKWGKGILAKAKMNSVYMPCAYSRNEYFVMEGGMEQARVSISKVFKQNLPKERKIANVVSSNTGWRKNFPVIFEAWANVLKVHPDALLYVHSDPSGYFSDGINLFKVMELYGVPEASVIFPPLWEYSCGALGTNFLNLVYNASNVHINACYGEGFGIPMIEAQAAGCPVVAPKFGGAGEVTKTGWLCDGKMINTVPGALQMLVDVNEMTVAILESFKANPVRKAVSEHVEEYEIDNVLEITTSFLEGLPCSPGC